MSKRLHLKDKVKFKFYDATTWLTNICYAHVAQYIGNQTMKFGQLTECNMRNIFLEKPCTKCGGETSPRPFSEKLKILYSLLLLYDKLRAIEIQRN